MTRLHFNAITGKFSAGPVQRKRDPEQARERGRSLSALNKARSLATQHGIEVDKESGGGWWVSCDNFTPENDPLDGSHFCADGREVLEAVQTYIEALGKK